MATSRNFSVWFNLSMVGCLVASFLGHLGSFVWFGPLRPVIGTVILLSMLYIMESLGATKSDIAFILTVVPFLEIMMLIVLDILCLLGFCVHLGIVLTIIGGIVLLLALKAINIPSFLGLMSLNLERRNPEFIYPMLHPWKDGLRLIMLYPGSNWDPINCTLEATLFRTNPEYIALSYAWGSMKHKIPITVNETQLDIGESLWNALYCLRDPLIPRHIWTEAICIDQNSLPEKAKQVPLMPLIYRRARKVVVWLGLHANVEPTRPETVKSWVLDMAEEEYWTRAWIIQEIGMARDVNVQAGSTVLGWNKFTSLVHEHCSGPPHSFSLRRISQLDDLRKSRYISGASYSLGTLLNAFQDCFCELSHDKIYAFLGLATWQDNEIMEINYEKSHMDVYQETVFLFKQKQASIEMVFYSALIRRLLTRRHQRDRKPRRRHKSQELQQPLKVAYAQTKILSFPFWNRVPTHSPFQGTHGGISSAPPMKTECYGVLQILN